MLELLVPFGFYFLTGVMIYSLPVLLKPSIAIFNRKRKTTRYFLYGFVTWFLYLSALANSGVLNDFSFPPRLAILVIIPVLVILYWYSGRPYLLKTIKSVPVERFIYIQAFRILVELLIWGAFLLGILPEVVTFEGLNFDVFVGISAIPVGWLAYKKKVSNTILLVWNVLSILVLVFTVFQFVNYFFLDDTLVADENTARFFNMPYLFLAGVLMPIAMFYHMVCIRRLRMD